MNVPISRILNFETNNLLNAYEVGISTMKFYLFVNKNNSFGGELMALVSDLSRSNLELAPGFMEWKAHFVAIVTRTQYLSILDHGKKKTTNYDGVLSS